MSDLRLWYEALERADAAGNEADAREIANYIRGANAQAAPTPTPMPTPTPETTLGGQAKEFAKGIPSGAIGLLQSAATGASAMLPEDYEKAAREKIEEYGSAAKAPFAPDAGYADTIPRKFGEALGSAAPFFALGPFGLAGKAAATGLGVGAGAGEARLRAEQEGGMEQRGAATGMGAVVGVTEVMPVFAFLNRLKATDPKMAMGLLDYVKRAFVTGGQEGAQEAAAALAQNLIAKGLYKPEQALVEGVGEEAAYGAGVGALIQGITDMALGGRRVKGTTTAQTEVDPEAFQSAAVDYAQQDEMYPGDKETGAAKYGEQILAGKEAQLRPEVDPELAQELSSLRDHYDVMQRQYESLDEQYKRSYDKEESDAILEAKDKLEPEQKALAKRIKALQRKVGPEGARPTTPKGQMGLFDEPAESVAEIKQPEPDVAEIKQEPSTIVDEPYLRRLGIKPHIAVAKRILGKDLSNPADAAIVGQNLDEHTQNTKSDVVRSSILEELQRPEFQGAPDGQTISDETSTKPIVSPTDGGVPVSEESIIPTPSSVEAPNIPGVVGGTGPARVSNVGKGTYPGTLGTDIIAAVDAGEKAKVAEEEAKANRRSGVGEKTAIDPNAVVNTIKEGKEPPGAKYVQTPEDKAEIAEYSRNVTSHPEQMLSTYHESAGSISRGLNFLAGDIGLGLNPKVAKAAYKALTPDQQADVTAQASKIKAASERGDRYLHDFNLSQGTRKQYEARLKEDLADLKTARDEAKATREARDKAEAEAKEAAAQVKETPAEKRARVAFETGAPQEAPAKKAPAGKKVGAKKTAVPEQPFTPKSKEEKEAQELAGEENPDEYEYTSKGEPLFSLSNITRAEAESLAVSPIVKVNALYKLKKARKLKEANKINDAQFEGQISDVISLLEQAKERGRYKGKVRGPNWIRAKLRTGVHNGTISDGEARFVEWLLDQNPNLAHDLAIRITTKEGNGVAGQYNMYGRLMTLFASNMDEGTAVHEILHHTERMMPEDVQEGIKKEWAAAWTKAYKNATPEVQAALDDMLLAIAGDTKAKERTMQAFQNGTLDKDTHYQLFGPSEYWAVNGARILADRNQAGGWVKKARQWLKELVQNIKGILGLRSDAPILKAISSLLESSGEFVSKKGLTQAVTNYSLNKAEPKLTAAGEKAKKLVEDMKGISNEKSKQPQMSTMKKVGAFFMDPAYRGGLERAFRVQVVSKTASVEDKFRTLFNGAIRDSLGEVRPDLFAYQAEHSDNIAVQVMKFGKLVLTKGLGWEAKEGKTSLQGVIDRVKNLGVKLGNQELAFKLANDAFIAKRANDLRGKGIIDEALIPDAAKTAAGLKAFKEFPELEEAFKEWTDYKNGLVDAMVDGGRITPQQAKVWKEGISYVPWNRLKDYEEQAANSPQGHFKGLVNLRGLKPLKGGEEEINNIFDNMVGLSFWMTNSAMRNHAALKITDAFLANDLGVRKVRQDQSGVDPNKVVTIYRDGIPESYEYEDPLDVYAFKGIESLGGPFLTAFTKMSNFLRKATTATPQFAISQLFQDSYRAVAFSGVNNPFSVPAKVIRGFIKEAGDDPLTKWINSLGIAGAVDLMPGRAQESIEKAFGIKQYTTMDKILSKMESFSIASDTALRKAVFQQTLDETKSKEFPEGDVLLARFRAQEIINFKRQGASKVVGVLRQMVPFMNAYIQGMDVLYRTMTGRGIAAKERQVAFGMFLQAGTKLAAMSTIYAMLVSGDDEYEGLRDYDKNKHFIFPGTGMKMPVAPEVGLLFKVIPERLYGYLISQSTDRPKDATELRKAIANAAFDALSGPNLTPQAVKPILEVYMNHSFFTNAPVVGRGMEYMAPNMQFTDATAELAKLLSNTAEQAGVELSPMKLEYLFRGFTGIAGGALLDISNSMFGDRPDKRLYEQPFAKTFMYDKVPGGYKEGYYAFRESVNEVTTTVNALKAAGRAEELVDYLEGDQKLTLYALRSTINKVDDQLGDIRKFKKIIAADPNMSGKDKKDAIEELEEAENDMVKAYNIPYLRKRIAEM